MSLKIAEWNTKARLANPDYSDTIVQTILGFDADVVIIPEAFNRGDKQFGTLDLAKEQFVDAGYDVAMQTNDDTDGRKDQRGIIALNRRAGDDPYPIDMVTRKAIGWSAVDPDKNRAKNQDC
jgi:hypothetical protein